MLNYAAVAVVTVGFIATALRGEVVIRTDGDRVMAGGEVFTVAPAESILIENEAYTLSSDKPDRWIKGTHLKGCLSKATVLPDCLEPGSVVVKLEDGTVMERGKDYVLDERWASLGRIEGGRIGKDKKVLLTYRAGQMRLDSIVADAAGKMQLARGQAKKMGPTPPGLPEKGMKAVANVFMPFHAKNVKDWQIFSIGDDFVEPDESMMRRRADLIPKTLAKLRAGEKVNVVTWGDSVTAGGDASKPGLAFPELFATRLRERFPKASVTLTNAGIGATNTVGRLPHLNKEVLDHHPDLVTIEFINDMGFPEEIVRKNYASAFDQIRGVGAEIILITPHFSMPEMMGKKYPRGAETRPTVELLRKIAAENHVALADVSRRWEHLDAEGIPYITLLDNGINHPDDRGHELFVKELMTFFPPD